MSSIESNLRLRGSEYVVQQLETELPHHMHKIPFIHDKLPEVDFDRFIFPDYAFVFSKKEQGFPSKAELLYDHKHSWHDNEFALTIRLSHEGTSEENTTDISLPSTVIENNTSPNGDRILSQGASESLSFSSGYETNIPQTLLLARDRRPAPTILIIMDDERDTIYPINIREEPKTVIAAQPKQINEPSAHPQRVSQPEEWLFRPSRVIFEAPTDQTIVRQKVKRQRSQEEQIKWLNQHIDRKPGKNRGKSTGKNEKFFRKEKRRIQKHGDHSSGHSRRY